MLIWIVDQCMRLHVSFYEGKFKLPGGARSFMVRDINFIIMDCFQSVLNVWNVWNVHNICF